MSKGYRTEGKQRLALFMSSHPDMHYTVDEICIELNGDLSCRSSIYRNLSALCSDGLARKFRAEGQSSFVYQYVGDRGECRDHFHLKCIECGRLVHLECRMGEELKAHIKESHGFTIDSGRSILYGVCKDCFESAQRGI